MTLFIFQFGFLQPIASIVNSQWPIAIFTIILLIIAVLENGVKIKKYVLFLIILITLFFFANALLYSENAYIILLTYLGFITKGGAGLVIGSLDTDGKSLNNAFLKIAVINFIVVSPLPFINIMDSINYMRYGYALVPSVLMFFILSVSKRSNKTLWISLFLVSFILMILYGSRGTIVVLIIFILMFLLFIKTISKIRKLMLFILLLTIGYILEKIRFLSKLIEFLYTDIGIKSYSLAKFRITLESGLAEASSGRDGIYRVLLGLISENPLYGYGVGYSQKVLDFTAHNMFIQILLETGIIGLCVWFIVWIFCIKKIIIVRNSPEQTYLILLLLLISLAIGRLLVSSDIWLRAEYWFTISLLFNVKSKVDLIFNGPQRYLVKSYRDKN